MVFFFFSSRRRHTRYWRDWSSDVCSSDLGLEAGRRIARQPVAEAAAGDQCNRFSHRVNCLGDAFAEPVVIIVGKITVAQRYQPSAPAVTLEEVERNSRAMIQIKAADPACDQTFLSR